MLPPTKKRLAGLKGVKTRIRNKRNPHYKVITENESRIEIYRGFEICESRAVKYFFIYGYNATYTSVETARKVIDTYLKRTTENDKA